MSEPTEEISMSAQIAELKRELKEQCQLTLATMDEREHAFNDGLEAAAQQCEANFQPTSEGLRTHRGGLNEAARRYAREIRALKIPNYQNMAEEKAPAHEEFKFLEKLDKSINDGLLNLGDVQSIVQQRMSELLKTIPREEFEIYKASQKDKIMVGSG